MDRQENTNQYSEEKGGWYVKGEPVYCGGSKGEVLHILLYQL